MTSRAYAVVAAAVVVAVVSALVALKPLHPPLHRGASAQVATAWVGFVDTIASNGRDLHVHPHRPDTVSPSDQLIVTGWCAVSVSPPILPAVVVALDGTTLLATAESVSRPDVAEVYHDPRLADTGFALHFTLARGGPRHRVDVIAVAPNGQRHLVRTLDFITRS